MNTDDNFKISKYAYGKDYHEVIKEILGEFVAELQEEIGEFGFRVLLILLRYWKEPGQKIRNWMGRKNANLITKGEGPFIFWQKLSVNWN